MCFVCVLLSLSLYFVSCVCCIRLPVVVTYKKRSKAGTSWEGTAAAAQSGGGGEDTEKDEELTSGQFGITDPEDEGKDCGGKTQHILASTETYFTLFKHTATHVIFVLIPLHISKKLILSNTMVNGNDRVRVKNLRIDR